jgi:hypothetical protein
MFFLQFWFDDIMIEGSVSLTNGSGSGSATLSGLVNDDTQLLWCRFKVDKVVVRVSLPKLHSQQLSLSLLPSSAQHTLPWLVGPLIIPAYPDTLSVDPANSWIFFFFWGGGVYLKMTNWDLYI